MTRETGFDIAVASEIMVRPVLLRCSCAKSLLLLFRLCSEHLISLACCAVQAVLALSTSLADMRERLGNMVVGTSRAVSSLDSSVCRASCQLTALERVELRSHCWSACVRTCALRRSCCIQLSLFLLAVVSCTLECSLLCLRARRVCR